MFYFYISELQGLGIELSDKGPAQHEDGSMCNPQNYQKKVCYHASMYYNYKELIMQVVLYKVLPILFLEIILRE